MLECLSTLHRRAMPILMQCTVPTGGGWRSLNHTHLRQTEPLHPPLPRCTFLSLVLSFTLSVSFASVTAYPLPLRSRDSRQYRCIAVLSSSATPESQVTRQKSIPHIGLIASQKKIGTSEYKNPLCRNPSGFATEVFCTRTTASYRTYSATIFGAFSGVRPRAVGGWSVPNKEKKLFPLTLFL